MIRFEHSVFALPFALSGAWLAASGVPPLTDLAWIVLAAVAARSAAMAFNRLADRRLDAANPRTAGRELPSGRLSLAYAAWFTGFSAGIFVLAAFMLAPICGWLSVPVLVLLAGYSFLKRWTWFSHAGLGLALACAPTGAWLAVTKEFAPGWLAPLTVGLGVLFWVAGFDLLYALQDEVHDRQAGLRSIPARFGARAARQASAACFVLALALWGGAAWQIGLRWPFWLAWGGIAVLLASEHELVRRGGVHGVPAAFFTVNAWIGPLFFLGLICALPAAAAESLAWSVS